MHPSVHWKLIEGETCKQSISYMLQMVEELCTEDWVNIEERATRFSKHYGIGSVGGTPEILCDQMHLGNILQCTLAF